MDNVNKNLNRYILTLDKIKPEDELVEKAIQKVRTMRIEELENNNKNEKSSFLSLQTLSKLALGVAATFVISIVGTKYFFDSQPYSEKNISSMQQSTDYTTNTEVDIEHIDLNEFFNNIGLNEINENNFMGMYLVSERNNNGKWIEFNHSSNYNDFQNIKSLLNQFSKSVYILEDLGKIDTCVSSMCVQVNYNYEIYVPLDINGEIIIAKKENNKTQACCIQLAKADEANLQEMKNFIISTGEKCEEEPGAIDRNALTSKTEEDKSNNQNNDENNNQENNLMIYNSSTRYATIELYGNGELYIQFNAEEYSELEKNNISSDKKYIVNKNVKQVVHTYLGKEDYPIIIYLTNKGEIEYFKTEDVVTSGEITNILKVKDLSNVKELKEGASKKEGQESTGAVFAVLEDNAEVELELNIKY